MSNKLQLIKARNFGGIINASLTFSKLNFGPLIKVILLLVLPLAVLGGYFSSFGSIMAIGGIMEAHDVHEKWKLGSVMLLGVGLGWLALVVATFLQVLAVMQLFLEYERSESGRIEAKNIFTGIRNGLSRFARFYYVICAVGLLAALAFIMALTLAFKGNTTAATVILLGIFAMVAYVSVTYCFSPFVFMRECTGILQALIRSVQLIKNHWWQTFGIILIIYILLYVVSFAITAPFREIFFAGMHPSANPKDYASFETSIWGICSTILMTCVVTIMKSFVYVAVILQYYSLIAVKGVEDTAKPDENAGAPQTPQA